MKTALVAGATGLVGKTLLALLNEADEYQTIHVLVRQPLAIQHDKVVQHVINYDELGTWEQMPQVDDVFCCLGTTLKQAGSEAAFMQVDHDYVVTLAEQAQHRLVKQFIVVSALGADTASSVFYNRMKGETEQALSHLALNRLVILRPSMLIGKREKVRWAEVVGCGLLAIVSPFLLGRFERYKAVHVKRVAATMLTEARKGGEGITILESELINQPRTLD